MTNLTPPLSVDKNKYCEVAFCAVFGCQGAPHCTGNRRPATASVDKELPIVERAARKVIG